MEWESEIEAIVKRNNNRLNGWLEAIETAKDQVKAAKKKFHQWGGLRAYLSVSRINLIKRSAGSGIGTVRFSLRFLGQEVAELLVGKGEILLSLRKKDIKNNSAFHGFDKLDLLPRKYPWKKGEKESDASKRFRRFFEKPVHIKEWKTHSPEHLVESRILLEMLKRVRKDKFQGTFFGVQPVTICGFPLQVPLPVWASGGVPKEASQKGSVDILARRNNKKLSIWELKAPGKYQNQKTLRQAYIYAVTIIKMLRSPEGERWYRVFGFASLPEKIRVEAVVVITADKNRCLQQEYKKWKASMPLLIGKDTIELYVAHYISEDSGLKILSYQPIKDNE